MNSYQLNYKTNNIHYHINKIKIKTLSKLQRKNNQVKEWDLALFNIAFEHTFINYHS